MFVDKLKKQWFLIGVGLCCYWGYHFPWAGEKASAHLKLLVTILMFLMGLGIGFPALRRRMGCWRETGPILFLCYVMAAGNPAGIARPRITEKEGVIYISKLTATGKYLLAFSRKIW